MRYIVGFNDCTQWGTPMEYKEAMEYAKQFRNIHNAHVFKMVEVATFPKNKLPKIVTSLQSKADNVKETKK